MISDHDSHILIRMHCRDVCIVIIIRLIISNHRTPILICLHKDYLVLCPCYLSYNVSN